MSAAPVGTVAPAPERDSRLLYAGAIVVEVLVLLGIWFFQRYFSA